MPNIYVRSSDGLDTDSGATWALAKATLAGATAIDAAGDNIYLSSAHNESSAANQTIALAGTYSNPVKVISVSDTTEPPTTTQTGATVTTTGLTSITITGSGVIIGVTFSATTTAASFPITFASDQGFLVLDSCSLITNSTASTARITFGSTNTNSESAYILKNTSLKLALAGQGITITHSSGLVDGGGLLAGSAAITTFIQALQDCVLWEFINFDFSNAATALNLISASVPASGRIDFINCKMPANWSGGLCAGAPINPRFEAVMWNCGTYSHRKEMAAGTLIPETTWVKSGGSVEGTTPTSWKITTNSTANEHINYFVTEAITIQNTAIGSAKTVNIDILHDSATALTNADIWLEIDYLDAAGTTKGAIATNKRADILATPANHPASAVTWATTGMTNPNKQTLQCVITPQVAGNIYIRVCVGIVSKTLMLDYNAYLS